MPSELSVLTQKLKLTSIVDVQVTEAVSDGENGFVRSVKFFGEPAGENGSTLVLEVFIYADEKPSLAITTPELNF